MADTTLDLSLYQFDLPKDRIAAYPVNPRDSSKLLYVAANQLEHYIFHDLPSLLNETDILVFNRTKVSKRRHYLKRPSGALTEVVFLESITNQPSIWTCIIKKSGRLKIGDWLIGTNIQFQVKDKKNGLILLEATEWLTMNQAEDYFEKYGEPPIPPYLGRKAEKSDNQNYQTVFSEFTGSAAAPTAGLHFTENLLTQIEKKCTVAWVDLTIGYGTFAPLTTENFKTKQLHTEHFVIPEKTARILNKARNMSRIIAVGTTTLRALEANLRKNGRFAASSDVTKLFLYPPDRILSCNGLITNFHLPASSLFMLVCAFGGTHQVQAAYQSAIDKNYRFYSYGDAMFISH
ncbi:MAG: tRNA preQ1(34) S-adenosylmethionine ribosyltransferase-isomerase QueA [Leptonema sp. (in: Bacteria)]|nr:tRNA preQ1(34) S-adenosylmethionine ribosyltransferase-isomerase QueA [Leptonema sp. (in: bacteria)]